ncbi:MULTISPECIES: hypothetical protein [Clostridium]|uniref:DUF2187 domain-containing protein n=1 Tax=Clostridium lapidicellarium TaxID=3240931 RepID=A0ABV4DVX2_9CLOT
MDIKIGSTVKLWDGIKGKIIGQLEGGEYMIKSGKEILYCQKKDIVSVEK